MVQAGHGRIEWRGIEVLSIRPEPLGFPHVAQLARVDRIRELKGGRQEVETVWLITSLDAEQADAARLLELARQYWSIENGTHYRLDVSAGEDRCRVCAIRWRPRCWEYCAGPSKANTVPGRGACAGRARPHLSGLSGNNEPAH